MGVKVTQACSGGVTHFALAPDQESEDGRGVLTVAFGQNAANGELGFGPDAPKSATKPQRHEGLVGIEVLGCVFSSPFTLEVSFLIVFDYNLQRRSCAEYYPIPCFSPPEALPSIFRPTPSPSRNTRFGRMYQLSLRGW